MERLQQKLEEKPNNPFGWDSKEFLEFLGEYLSLLEKMSDLSDQNFRNLKVILQELQDQGISADYLINQVAGITAELLNSLSAFERFLR